MKSRNFIVQLALVLLLSICTSFTPAERKPFLMAFRQDGKEVAPVKGADGGDVLKLRKIPFDIVFTLPGQEGIFVNAWTGPDTYDGSAKSKKWEDYPGLSDIAMSQAYHNTDQQILYAKMRAMYWYYKNDNENRFNRIEKKNDAYICTRTISSFANASTEDNVDKGDVDIADFGQDIYMIFVDGDHDYKNGAYTGKIYQRYRLKIEWVE